MGKLVWIVIILIVISGIWYFGFRGDDSGVEVGGDSVETQKVPAPGSEGVEETIVVSDENNGDDAEDMGSSLGEVKTFVLTGENFKFIMNGGEAPELRVNEGDTVIIEFTSTDGFHDWVVDEFDAATERVSTDGSTSVEFVVDKKGTFEYYCSVGSHRQQGMFGNLIVE